MLDEANQILVKEIAPTFETYIKALAEIEKNKYGRIVENDENPMCITKFSCKKLFKGDKVFFQLY